MVGVNFLNISQKTNQRRKKETNWLKIKSSGVSKDNFLTLNSPEIRAWDKCLCANSYQGVWSQGVEVKDKENKAGNVGEPRQGYIVKFSNLCRPLLALSHGSIWFTICNTSIFSLFRGSYRWDLSTILQIDGQCLLNRKFTLLYFHVVPA